MAIGDVKNENDRAIGSVVLRPPALFSQEPNDSDILVWNTAVGAYVSAQAIQANTFVATDDAGLGDVASDVNATDFTGQDPIIGTAASIPTASTTTFVHKLIAYSYVGPKPVTLGVGGNYTALGTDFVAQGTADHDALANRTDPDQHTTAAITGLDQDQTDQDAATALVQTNLDTHENAPADRHTTAQITNLDSKQLSQDNATALVQSNLDDHEGAVTSHNQSQILNLVTDQNTQNSDIAQNAQNLIDHVAAADPHPQYVLEATQTGLILYGVCADFLMSTGNVQLTNYSFSGFWNGGLLGDLDAIAGEITIPSTGVWKLSMLLTGLQGNALKEEQMAVGILVDGTPSVLSAFDVATDKTNGRTFSAVLSRSLTVGQVIALYGTATANLGTFGVLDVSFELQRQF